MWRGRRRASARRTSIRSWRVGGGPAPPILAVALLPHSLPKATRSFNIMKSAVGASVLTALPNVLSALLRRSVGPWKCLLVGRPKPGGVCHACLRTTGIVVDGPTELCGDCQSARTVRRGHCRRHRVSPPPMPQARLTRTDIANLSVYSMSLKRP